MANTQYLSDYIVTRKTLTNANEEYTQALSARPTRIAISSDDLTSQVLFSFIELGSATGKRIFQGAEWTSPGFVFGSKTVYLQSPNAGTVAVI